MNKTIDLKERKRWAVIIDRGVRVLLISEAIDMPEVAKRSRIKLPTLYEKLRGDGPLEIAEINDIAGAFGIDAIELLTIGSRSEGSDLRSRLSAWVTAAEAA